MASLAQITSEDAQQLLGAGCALRKRRLGIGAALCWRAWALGRVSRHAPTRAGRCA